MHRSFLKAALLFLVVTPLFGQGANTPITEGNSGQTIVQVTFTLNFPINNAVTGQYQTVDGTATAADNDYTPVSGTFVIPGGQTTSAPVQFAILGDTKVEPDETFSLTISGLPPGIPVDPGPFTYTIINDDVATVAVAGASVTEGNAGVTAMTFNISLTAAAAVPIDVTFRTVDGTATAGVDYQAAQGTITFAPGEVRRGVVVNVNGDTAFEPDETFNFIVTATGGSTATAVGTIVNDDARPPDRLTIVSGNNQGGRLAVPLAQPLVVQVVDANGGAISGATVQWRVTRGNARLEPETSTTNAQGRASTNVTLLSVGTVEVQASLAGLTPVTFTLASETGFDLRARGPVAVPIARALVSICGRNDETFLGTCRALSLLSDDNLTTTLERVAPQQSGAQSKIAGEVVSAVTSGIGSRLAALRSGVQRFSVQQLAITQNGKAIPVATLASLFIPQVSDEPENDVYNGWSAFISGNLGTGERVGRFGQLGFDLETRGVMIGVDRLFGENVFGLSLNLMQLDSELNDGVGTLDTTGYALSLYGSRGGLFDGGAPGGVYEGIHLDGSITVGRNSHEAEHVVDIPSMPLSRATSENDADVFAVSGGAGIDLHRGRTDFDLSLTGTYSKSRIDDLTEEGSGPLILFVQGHDIESLVATAGLNVRAAWAVPFGTILPSARAELVHEFKNAARLVTARFLRDTLGTSFTVPLDQPDENYGRVAAGLQGVFPRGVSAFLEVTQDISRSDLRFRTLQFSVSKSF